MKKIISVVLAALMAFCVMPITSLAGNSEKAVYKFVETVTIFGVIYDDGTGEAYYFNGEEEPYIVNANEVGAGYDCTNMLLCPTAQAATKSIEDWADELGVSKSERSMTTQLKYPPYPYFTRSTAPDQTYTEISDAKDGELITRYASSEIIFEGHIYTAPEPAVEDGWNKIDGKWYFYKDNVAQTGWVKDGGKWYFMNSDGVMQTGWVKAGNAWYYMNSNGAMQTGWQKIGGAWYYFKSGGAMATGWQKVGSSWYYFLSGGAMKTGWQKVGSAWYYLQSSGAMKTGWLKDGGKWYYLEASGAMLANTSRKIGSKTYKFNSSGQCTNP